MGNGIKSSYFAIVLYDDDILHRHVIEYIRSCPLWLDYYVMICHDKDCVEPLRYSKSENELDVCEPMYHVKKRHFHVLLKLKCRTSLQPFLKMFGVKGDKLAVQYALAVQNPFAYVTYMLHADFESLHDDKKFKYKMSDLVYSLRAETLLDSQNGNFVQYFTDILDKLADGLDIWEIAKEATLVLSPASAQEYISIIRQFQYLFVNRGGKLSLHSK